MRTRADNKDGSCREILSGKHAGKWRVQFTPYTEFGKGNRLSRIFPTKTEAKDFLQQLRRGERIEQARRERELTLAEWFTWLAENDWPETLAPLTIDIRRSRFKKYVEKHLGATPLSKLDPMRVRSFYRMLRDEGVSESLVISVRTDLVRAFNQALSPYGRVPMTMANPFRLSLPTPEPRQAVALTAEEVRQALRSPKLTTSQRAQLGLFLLGGLRLGEVMAITRGQLRFDENLIHIDRAVQVAFGGKQSVGRPKGGKIRQAVMCQTLKDLLLPHVEDMSEDALLWPAATENKPRMKKLTYCTWRTIVKAAKLPAGMSPHDCRLTHVNLIEKHMPDVSVTTLKAHIGHAAVGVTETNYTRPLTTAQQVLRDELDRVFGKEK